MGRLWHLDLMIKGKSLKKVCKLLTSHNYEIQVGNDVGNLYSFNDGYPLYTPKHACGVQDRYSKSLS